MAVFRYRMQSILNIKYKLEEQEKLMYAQAQAEVARQEELLAAFVARREEYEGFLRRAGGQRRLNVLELRRLRDGCDTLTFHIEEQKQRVAAAQKKADGALARLTEAIKERKIHEKLREKALAEFLAEENRAERQGIDELVSYQFGTNRAEGGSV